MTKDSKGHGSNGKGADLRRQAATLAGQQGTSVRRQLLIKAAEHADRTEKTMGPITTRDLKGIASTNSKKTR